MSFGNAIRQELQESFPQSTFVRNRTIAVLLPCYNEEASIAGTLAGFRKALPGASLYVYDNNSTDRTADIARENGAIVRYEPYQGKGHVIRRMFADIEADIYVLADGDQTYDASAAGRLIDVLVNRNCDMVVGCRIGQDGAFPKGHRFGNQMFNRVVGHLFGSGFTDILSGYRVVSRRFVKSFPAASGGFEIETELSIHALDLRLATQEIALPYGSRPEHSRSKLRTFHDGFRILHTILRMYKMLKPLRFFSLGAGILAGLSALAGMPILFTYWETGLVPRLPSAILAAGLAQMSALSLTCGLIIEAISASRREFKRMRYLDLPAPGV
jgi:glycosyltransferase involved in cell wall biosynthesis